MRVACLGDSITAGAGTPDPDRLGYPAQLADRLGEDYQVRAFGAPGAMLLAAGERPYVETDAFHEAVAWKPNIAVVLLGSDETLAGGGRPNWEHETNLERDAAALIQALRGDDLRVRVLLCSPPPMFPERAGLSKERAGELRECAPRLERVREALRRTALSLKVVQHFDLARTLTAERTVDGVHPDPLGAEAIADFLYDAIEIAHDVPAQITELLAREGTLATPGNFHGFPSTSFRLRGDGSPCTIVAPHVPMKGRPYVLRLGPLPQDAALDLALLDRGFALASIDLTMYAGTPRAVQGAKKLHDTCARMGLAWPAVVIGDGPSGLGAFSFAADLADHVRLLVLRDAVTDARTWPGGVHGARSDVDWQRYLALSQLTEEQALQRDPYAPERMQKMTLKGVQVLAAFDPRDERVPPGENGRLLATVHAALGGQAELFPSTRGARRDAALLRAILRAYGHESCFATRALPSAEFRAIAAGWGEGTWWDQLAAMVGLARGAPPARVVLLGDATIQALTDVAARRSAAGGERPFDLAFGDLGALNAGIWGDRCEHIAYRVEHGALSVLDPSVVVLQVGVNGVIARGRTAAETSAGIEALVHRIREQEPDAHVLVLGPFPAGATPDDPLRQVIDGIHERVEALEAHERVHYVDLRSLFLDEQGHPNELLAAGGIRLTPPGQAAWLDALAPLVREFCAD